jgi:hypothetical protein
MGPDRLHDINADAVLCLTIVVAVPLVALAGTHYAISRLGVTTLYRPSWNRSPLQFWKDPLQLLFVATVVSGAALVGSALRLSGAGWDGFWMFVFYCALVAGLLLARVVTYRVFLHRIATH